VYQSDDGIHVMGLDGSGDELLDLGGAGSVHPDWSPEGDRIAYVRDSVEIWSADADGAGQSLVVACDAGCDFLDNPAWSPDGTRMAYARFASTGGLFTGSTIEVLDLTTGSHRSVMGTTAPEFVSAPRWSPEGGSIVAHVDRYPDQPLRVDNAYPVVATAVVVADIRGTGMATAQMLEGWEMFAAYPDWHPTDDLIVFNTYDLSGFEQTDRPSNLYTVRPDGTGLTQLTGFGPSDTRATQPTWTPDGLEVIFTLVEDAVGDFDNPRRTAFVHRGGTELRTLERIDRTHPRVRPSPSP
jgi:dipeptidyl aminopeptidase/acylaminoacyl peptidase